MNEWFMTTAELWMEFFTYENIVRFARFVDEIMYKIRRNKR